VFSSIQKQKLNEAEAPMELPKDLRTDSIKTGRSIASSNRGIALLITLWLLVILSVMAFSFSSLVRTETYSTYAFKEGIENKYFAEAGIQRGIAEIYNRLAAKNNKTPDASRVLESAFQVDGTSYTDKIGEGQYKIRITDEGGKINLNALSEQTGIILDNYLVNAGVEKEKADAIVDSILDWKDEDNEVRSKGAESDYYKSLPNPYKAKNREFDSLEELILVKGMTNQLLYGDDEHKGLIHFLTIYHQAPQLNLDVAPKEVLAAIPGMTPDAEEGILKARIKNDVDAIRNYQNKIGNKNQTIMPFLGVGESNIYTISAVGYKENEKKGYAIVATVLIDGNNKYQYLYYKSPGYIMQ